MLVLHRLGRLLQNWCWLIQVDGQRYLTQLFAHVVFDQVPEADASIWVFQEREQFSLPRLTVFIQVFSAVSDVYLLTFEHHELLVRLNFGGLLSVILLDHNLVLGHLFLRVNHFVFACLCSESICVCLEYTCSFNLKLFFLLTAHYYLPSNIFLYLK